MVRPRKQLKSSGTGGGRTESTVAPGTCPDTGPPLVSLPAEIQCIITSYVNTPLSNALRAYAGYHANGSTLACSITRPEPPLLYV